MTTFPGSPKLINGGLVLIDPTTAAVQRIIAFQFNPETLSRSLDAQDAGESSDRAEALRLTGPPIETLQLEAEFDAADSLEVSDATAIESGLLGQLSALETIVYPTSATIQQNNERSRSGTLEIVPMQSPLVLFVWSKHRVVPVRITSFSITEEAFDPDLNPIRATVSLSLRVLSIDDLGFDHKGGSLYMIYQQTKERFAAGNPASAFGELGIGGIP